MRPTRPSKELPVNRTPRLLALAATAAFLVAVAAGCGSSGGSEGSSDGAAKTTDTATETSGSDAGSDDEASADGAEDCAATADSNNLSGDAVVLFAADQSEQSEADLTEETTAVIATDGASMDPGTLEVAAGTMFGIEAAADASLDAVVIGCAGGQTLVPGTAVGFVITEPGTYPVSLDISGAELGTIVVS